MKGEYALAVAAYEKALELSPSTAKHQADLDQARQKLKEHEAREAAKVRTTVCAHPTVMDGDGADHADDHGGEMVI